MSWDANLVDDGGAGHYGESSWNSTHNTNAMANLFVDVDVRRAATIRWWRERGRLDIVERIEADPTWEGSWWEVLDGMSGPEGAALLNQIIEGLEREWAQCEAMNPKNGWGSRDGLVAVLRSMRDAVPEWPTTWTCSG